MSMTRREFVSRTTLSAAAVLATGTLAGCTNGSQSDSNSPAAERKDAKAPTPVVSSDIPTVYFTSDITPAGLMAIFEAIGRTPHGNVGVKVSTGEAGGHNYLKPELIGELVQSIEGTILECNTAYGGSRSTTEAHLQVAAEHGFTSIADVDIMDADGDVVLPVEGGQHLTEDYVGASFIDYDFVVNLAHFKGHTMGGFGGVLKNASIGIASSRGKSWIHTGGTQMSGWTAPSHDVFLESMAEAAKAVADHLGENVVYIDIMNNLSVDCDCDSHPADPEMADIGILGSTDPVALDQACVDLVYAAEDSAALIERIESRNGLHTLEYAEAIGLGSRQYNLVDVNAAPEGGSTVSASTVSLTLNGAQFTIDLADNQTAAAFAVMLPLQTEMSELNGNEKYVYLNSPLPTNATNPGTVEAGDVMLYGETCLVIFYKSHSTSYSYTRIGKIQNVAGLKNAVGSGSINATFALA